MNLERFEKVLANEIQRRCVETRQAQHMVMSGKNGNHERLAKWIVEMMSSEGIFVEQKQDY